MNWIHKTLLALAAAASILIGFFQFGKKTQKEDDRVSNLEDFIETKKEIGNVEASPDRDSAVERLRDNGWTR